MAAWGIAGIALALVDGQQTCLFGGLWPSPARERVPLRVHLQAFQCPGRHAARRGGQTRPGRPRRPLRRRVAPGQSLLQHRADHASPASLPSLGHRPRSPDRRLLRPFSAQPLPHRLEPRPIRPGQPAQYEDPLFERRTQPRRTPGRTGRRRRLRSIPARPHSRPPGHDPFKLESGSGAARTAHHRLHACGRWAWRLWTLPGAGIQPRLGPCRQPLHHRRGPRLFPWPARRRRPGARLTHSQSRVAGSDVHPPTDRRARRLRPGVCGREVPRT